MKPQKYDPCSLNRIILWLTLLALLLLSGAPTPPAVAAVPTAATVPPGRNQHIKPGQTPAGLSANPARPPLA